MRITLIKDNEVIQLALAAKINIDCTKEHTKVTYTSSRDRQVYDVCFCDGGNTILID